MEKEISATWRSGDLSARVILSLWRGSLIERRSMINLIDPRDNRGRRRPTCGETRAEKFRARGIDDAATTEGVRARKRKGIEGRLNEVLINGAGIETGARATPPFRYLIQTLQYQNTSFEPRMPTRAHPLISLSLSLSRARARDYTRLIHPGCLKGAVPPCCTLSFFPWSPSPPPLYRQL